LRRWKKKSTTGHSLTLHKPLRVLEIEKNFYGVSGSPADCVHMGLSQIMKNKKPNLILSGINRGANLGQDVFYSGTVSAAREGCIQGLPAVAVSLAIDFKSRKKETQLHYDSAVHYTCELVQRIRKKEIILPQHSLLNLNIPDLPVSKIRGLRVVRQGEIYLSHQ
jgi:5'-nucleotidase